MLALPPGSLPPPGGVVRVPDLLDLEMVTGVRDMLAGAGVDSATAFTPAVETELRGSSLYLVLAGAGAAVLPRALAELGRAGGVVIVPFGPPQSRHSYVLRRAAPLSPAAQALHSLLRRRDNRSAGAVRAQESGRPHDNQTTAAHDRPGSSPW